MNEQVRDGVRKAIEQRGVSQREIADRLGIKPENLSRMLNGRVNGVSKLWRGLLETLDLELTAVPRAADNG